MWKPSQRLENYKTQKPKEKRKIIIMLPIFYAVLICLTLVVLLGQPLFGAVIVVWAYFQLLGTCFLAKAIMEGGTYRL